jgi:hypothetical protein
VFSGRNVSPTRSVFTSGSGVDFEKTIGATYEQTSLQRKLWTNKKVTEFDASTMTPAAFQSGSLNRWLPAKLSGVQADTGLTELKRIHLFQQTPFGQKTLT